MIHLLLVVAAIIFVVWLILHIAGAVLGGALNLLWILIVVALAIWLWRMVTGRNRTTAL